MSIWGKLLGGAAGFAIGGPIGLLIGVAAGHLADNVRVRAGQKKLAAGNAATRQQVFAIALIALSAKMAKADGTVTRDEVDAFKAIFRVPSKDVKAVAQIFNQAKSDANGFEEYAEQVASVFQSKPEVLEELIGALIHIAMADGTMHPNERSFLLTVSEIFGFSSEHFEKIAAQHGASEANDPYKILGIEITATNDEIKSTYRSLVRENHPDKLIAKGMPEEMVDLATEKLAAINDAYSKIEKQRGI